MKSSVFSLPIFPLPVFLLPRGITRLRIFEARYLKMVKIATRDRGFAIIPYVKETDLAQQKWASWVEIINFDQGDDGVLMIDVECKKLVEVSSLTTDSDNLTFGKVTEFSHWTEEHREPLADKLAISLQHVFEESESLNELYSTAYIHDPAWVVARWLELMPIELSVKQVFAEQASYDNAKDFIESIIFSETALDSDLN